MAVKPCDLTRSGGADIVSLDLREHRSSSQLGALAYNPGNRLRTLATPEPIKDWSLTSLKEKLIKIGAKVVCYGRDVAFQMAKVAIPSVRRHFGGLCPKPRADWPS